MLGPGTETGINQVYQGSNFQAIGLDWYPNSNATNVSSYQQATGVTYPLCIGASGTRAAYKAYEANDVSMVIDQEGIVRYRGAGVNTSQITGWIDNLLTTSVEEKETFPVTPRLEQNYPNPFNPETRISFRLTNSQKVMLQIYDNEGRLIKNLIEDRLQAGRHEVSWNGKTAEGLPAASGIYFYVLQTGNFRSAKKMILTR